MRLVKLFLGLLVVLPLLAIAIYFAGFSGIAFYLGITYETTDTPLLLYCLGSLVVGIVVTLLAWTVAAILVVPSPAWRRPLLVLLTLVAIVVPGVIGSIYAWQTWSSDDTLRLF